MSPRACGRQLRRCVLGGLKKGHIHQTLHTYEVSRVHLFKIQYSYISPVEPFLPFPFFLVLASRWANEIRYLQQYERYHFFCLVWCPVARH